MRSLGSRSRAAWPRCRGLEVRVVSVERAGFSMPTTYLKSTGPVALPSVGALGSTTATQIQRTAEHHRNRAAARPLEREPHILGHQVHRE